MLPLRLVLIIYNLLLPLLILTQLPAALRKMRQRRGRWQDLLQRLSIYPPHLLQRLSPSLAHPHRIWMHAVSVGETNVALKLIQAILSHHPGTTLILTVTTPTAHQIATQTSQQHPHRLTVLYSPLDLPIITRRSLNIIAPHQLILVEAEVWPNLVSHAHQQNIPISLVNTRLSPRSARRYQQFKAFLSPIFRQLTHICVQEPEDSQHWLALGIPPPTILHTGSIKYDPQGSHVPLEKTAALIPILHAAGIHPDTHLILLAASTHQGEELAIAQIHQQLITQHPAEKPIALILVPRHMERSPAILEALRQHQIHPTLRSTLTAHSPHPPPTPQNPLLIDTTGELAAWQTLAHIVIIGKSLLAHGGQNPAEAALAGKAIIMGPNMENFTPLVQLLLRHDAAIQLPTIQQLPTTLQNLISQQHTLQKLGQNAQNALNKHAGATQNTLKILSQHIS